MILNSIQKPTVLVQRCQLLPTRKPKLLSTKPVKVCSRIHSFPPTEKYHADEKTLPSAVDQSSFLKQFGLAPVQSSDIPEKRKSETVDCNVIVIDDDDEDDDRNFEDSCIDDLFGTTRRLRGDRDANGSTTSRLLQPCSRLRKLLAIDISSALGSRTLQHVICMLKSDSMPLNPYTVSHTLTGDDNTLDYGMFCRTPIKGSFTGRLRQRDFPVRYRPMSVATYYHHYCFSRADRRKFCRRFDRGLSFGSYRRYLKLVRCTVSIGRLTAQEITDWRSSKRLRDYVSRMEEKDKTAPVVADLPYTSAAATNDTEVINVSSDSEDSDVPSSVSKKRHLSEDDDSSPDTKKHDLAFRCHQCNIQLPCSRNSRRLIREHFRTSHGIRNIEFIRISKPDGSFDMQIIQLDHVPQQSSSAFPYHTVTATEGAPILPHLHPSSSSQLDVFEVPGPSNSGDPMAANCHAHQAFVSSQSTENHTAQPPEVNSGRSRLLPLSRMLFGKATSLLNGVLRRGDNAASSAQSVMDEDVICLD